MVKSVVSEMPNPDALLSAEDRWETEMGAWFPGQRVVFRGKDLFSDLRNARWIGLLVYGITGREYDETKIRFFEGFWTLCCSFPDPRLWNNRVAALAGTSRTTQTLGITAAIASSEARIFGTLPTVKAMRFLMRAARVAHDGELLDELVLGELRTERVIAGYGRPIVRTDERVEPLMELAEELGLEKGLHVRTALEIERRLLDRGYRMCLNASGAAAAWMADLGFTPAELMYAAILAFSAGIIPCYIDALDHPEGTFFPLRCDRIQYTGPGQREW